MMIALWVLTLFTLGVWSFAAWALHALLTLDASRLGDLKPLIDQIPYADAISAWIPGFQDLLRLMVDATQWSLSWLGSAAPVIAWVVWGLGVAVILLVALALTVLIRVIRKSSGGSGPQVVGGR
jgi:hypothetical protein